MLRPLIFRTLVTNFALAALGLLNSIFLSRWLGPTGRGEVAAAMLWPTLLVYLSSLGLISATLYFAALPGSKPTPIFVNATFLSVAQSVAAFIVGFAALPLLLHSQTASVVGVSRLYLLVIPISLVAQNGSSILQGRLRISTFNWLRTILPAGYLIGTIILVIIGRLGLLNIIILHLCLNVVAVLATLVALARSGIRLASGFDSLLAKQMLKYGAKVHVGNVSGLANMSLDQVLLAALLPSNYLGLYVAAVSAASVSQVFSQAVQMVSTPSIAQRESAAERAAVLQAVFHRYWLLSFLVALAIGVLLPVAIPAVFGASFKGAIWPAEVLLLGGFFIGAKDVLSGGAQALGNPWLGSKAHLFALVITVGLLCLLLPAMGIMGAAIATSTAYLSQLVVVAHGLRRYYSISLIDLFRFNPKDLRSALGLFELIKGSREQLAPEQR